MRRASLRLPNGCLSPAAFHPVPRSGVTPALASAAGAAPGSLLLPITFSLLWEQQIDAGARGVAWAAQKRRLGALRILLLLLRLLPLPPLPPLLLVSTCASGLASALHVALTQPSGVPPSSLHPCLQAPAVRGWRATWPQTQTATCCFAC